MKKKINLFDYFFYQLQFFTFKNFSDGGKKGESSKRIGFQLEKKIK